MLHRQGNTRHFAIYRHLAALARALSLLASRPYLPATHYLPPTKAYMWHEGGSGMAWHMAGSAENRDVSAGKACSSGKII